MPADGQGFVMIHRRVMLWAVACWLVTGHAHAGPIEVFTGISVQPGNPDAYALNYLWGGSGLFITTDAGKNFGLICTSAMDPALDRSPAQEYITSANAMYVGNTDGLWRGGVNGCGWKAVPELKAHWIAALALDPLDPQITYLSTAGGAGSNSVWRNDGKSETWAPFGTQSDKLFNTLHVVKHGTGRRFYTTEVLLGDEARYFTSASDDDGKTWTENELTPIDQFGTKDPYAEMRIVAVDPSNVDHIVAVIDRKLDRAENMTVDDIIYSLDQGKNWALIGHVTTLTAITFKPDGTLLYGDNDQSTPGLYIVDKLGAAPRKLSMDWKVGCLQYDSAKDVVYACHDWQFGTVDLESGAFTTSLDMRKATTFLDCPGEAPIADQCSAQLNAAYCGLGHYPQAPVCSAYDRPWYDPALVSDEPSACGCAMSAGAGGGGSGAGGAGSGGMSSAAGSGDAGSMAAGEGGASGADAAGNAGSAGAKPAAGSGGANAPKRSSGCGVTGAVSGSPGAGALWGIVIFAGLARSRRRAQRG
jgi:hypothetical protein